MPRIDRVRDLLRARGVADHVVRDGLRGLVAAWERFAREVAAGYTGGLDEWLNDVDGREILDAALAVASTDERRALRRRVRLADELARAHSRPAGRCLWGAANAAKHGWNPGRNWWYFMQPKSLDADFAREIASR